MRKSTLRSHVQHPPGQRSFGVLRPSSASPVRGATNCSTGRTEEDGRAHAGYRPAEADPLTSNIRLEAGASASHKLLNSEKAIPGASLAQAPRRHDVDVAAKPDTRPVAESDIRRSAGGAPGRIRTCAPASGDR